MKRIKIESLYYRNLYNVSEKILDSNNMLIPVYCDSRVFNYVNKNYKIDLDEKILDNELDNIDLISCENSDPDNRKYNDLINELKEKLSMRFSISIKSIERFNFLFHRVRNFYEINNKFAKFEYRLDDIIISIEKKYNDRIGWFYLLNKLE